MLMRAAAARHCQWLLSSGRRPCSIAAACLSIVMTGTFVVGMLERRDKTMWRLGMDSGLALLVFAGGLAGLASLT